MRSAVWKVATVSVDLMEVQMPGDGRKGCASSVADLQMHELTSCGLGGAAIARTANVLVREGLCRIGAAMDN